MRRKTFDALLATGGLVVAVLLLAAGGLLSWGHSFVNNEVHNQLAAQKIFFPPAGSDALKSDPDITKNITPYAGQQVLTGQEAEKYADHFIGNHLKAIGGGQTYAQLSAKSLADPTNTKLAGQVETMFKGETLRGLLLNAYAFGKMATIAGIAAIVSFIGAGIMLLLAGLGLWHSRRVAADVEVLPRLGAKVPAPVET
jgi:hypothetical protein